MHQKEALIRIADFDGTFTRETGDAYESAWAEKLAKRLAVPHGELVSLLAQARSEVLDHPEKYGWDIDGRLVAPATSDRFLLMNAATQIVVNKLRPNLNTAALLDDIFKICYPLAQTEFKDGAREYIEEQHRTGKFVIVTNSATDKVSQKLEKLMGPDNGIVVVGNAKKFKVVSDSPQITMPGLKRPVFTDRPFYKGVLLEIMKGSKEGVVFGDVAELDLVVPLLMGLKGILVTSDTTPKWEVDYVNAHPNGKSVDSLEAAAVHIRSLI